MRNPNFYNVVVANKQEKSKYSLSRLEKMIKAQIENSLVLGWPRQDIILLTNFNFSFMGVNSIYCNLLDKNCLTGSKTYAAEWLMRNEYTKKKPIWLHDLDAWQSEWFDLPYFKDVGITEYSVKGKINGGSIFYRDSSKDIVNKIFNSIVDRSSSYKDKEEPIIQKILRGKESNPEYKKRITTLNHTYNIGCSGYVKRWNMAEKPIKVVHFHPDNIIAWETHALDRNGLDIKGISSRLEKLIRKYWTELPTELSEKGKIAHEERKSKRIKEEKGNC